VNSSMSSKQAIFNTEYSHTTIRPSSSSYVPTICSHVTSYLLLSSFHEIAFTFPLIASPFPTDVVASAPLAIANKFLVLSFEGTKTKATGTTKYARAPLFAGATV